MKANVYRQASPNIHFVDGQSQSLHSLPAFLLKNCTCLSPAFCTLLAMATTQHVWAQIFNYWGVCDNIHHSLWFTSSSCEQLSSPGDPLHEVRPYTKPGSSIFFESSTASQYNSVQSPLAGLRKFDTPCNVEATPRRARAEEVKVQMPICTRKYFSLRKMSSWRRFDGGTWRWATGHSDTCSSGVKVARVRSAWRSLKIGAAFTIQLCTNVARVRWHT